MKKYLIGNWKSNKTAEEVELFFKILNDNLIKNKKNFPENIEAVICPAFIHLDLAGKLIQKYNLPLKLGVQDVSPFSAGSYTGEIYAAQIKEYAQYCLIGHSERRKYFKEEDNLLKLKVNEAIKSGLTVIYCVPDVQTTIPQGVDLVAFEPVFAIGTGIPDTPENAGKTISEIKSKNSVPFVIYGGSVTAENIGLFLKQKSIDGVLPGKASLDADHYYRMLTNAAL